MIRSSLVSLTIILAMAVSPNTVAAQDDGMHMRDVLVAKGYSVVFQEFSGGHSSINWRGTVSTG